MATSTFTTPSGLCSFADIIEGASSCNDTNLTMPMYPFHNSSSIEGNFTEVVLNQRPMAEDVYRNFLTQSRFWIQRVLVPAIMIVGVIGNVVTIVIMTRRRMRSSTNNYLAALAIFDMMYLVFIFILSLSHYPNAKSITYYEYWRLKPFIIMLTDASSNTSVWLTVTFTVERYIAVCHPMKGKILCTESRAKKAIIFVFLFCFTFTLPTPFEWAIIETFDPETNLTMVNLGHSELGKNNVYKTIYYWLTVVLFILVPFLLLAIFNSFLIRSVHLSKLQRKSMTRCNESRDHSRQENKITVMLIAVVILFFICQLPTAFHLLYMSFKEEFEPNEEAMLYGLGNVFNFLMAINAAGNFVLYCLLSQKYRRTFLQIFCPCLKGKISRLHSMYQNTVCTTMDTESPGFSRKMSTRSSYLISSPRGSSAGLSPPSRRSSSASRSAYLQVPNSTGQRTSRSAIVDSALQKLAREEMTSERGSVECVECRSAFRHPWERLKRSVSKKEVKEQSIPLQSGNRCIVITSPDGSDIKSQWNNDAV